jgi:pilus assembly protein CpaC
MKISLAVLLLSALEVSSAHAQTSSPAPATPATPVTHRRPIVNNETYAHSRYTSDKSEAEADHRQILLAAGNDKVIDLDSDFKAAPDRKETVFTGNTSIVNVAMVKVGDQTQLVIKPIGEGETNVTIRDKNGKVRIILDVIVAKQNLIKYAERLKEQLKEVEGITVGIEDQKIVIRGEVLTPNDYGTIINELADKTYGDAVVNKATMSAITLGALAKKIETDVQVYAPTVRTYVLNSKIILDGSVESEAAKTRVLRRAEWYLPSVKISDPIAGAANAEKNDKPLQIIQSDIQVTPAPPKRESKLVRLTIYFVELSKDFLKSFAFKWQPGFTADPSISIGSTANGAQAVGGGGGGFTFSGTLSSLFPTFSSNPSSASYGRVLKSETIITKSGAAGHMDNKQQIPTQVVGQNGTTGAGASVAVGTSLDITPTILQGQDVDLDVDLKENALVGKGIGGTPIVDERGVKTRLYLKSGETAAVAGVTTQDIATTFNRDDPNATTATGSIKALFNLQRSKNMSKARGQFVVFVSPQIIESASEGTEDLKKNFRIPTSNR